MAVIEMIEHAVNKTVEKYHLDKSEFIKNSFNGILTTQKFDQYTSDDHARADMFIIGIDGLTIELIRGALISREISIANGDARHLPSSRDLALENTQQAQNYIYSRICNDESPSLVYAEVSNSPHLKKLLSQNFADLLTSTTPQERYEATISLLSQFPSKIRTLDNTQNMIMEHNRKILAQIREQRKMSSQHK